MEQLITTTSQPVRTALWISQRSRSTLVLVKLPTSIGLVARKSSRMLWMSTSSPKTERSCVSKEIYTATYEMSYSFTLAPGQFGRWTFYRQPGRRLPQAGSGPLQGEHLRSAWSRTGLNTNFTTCKKGGLK